MICVLHVCHSWHTSSSLIRSVVGGIHKHKGRKIRYIFVLCSHVGWLMTQHVTEDDLKLVFQFSPPCDIYLMLGRELMVWSMLG